MSFFLFAVLDSHKKGWRKEAAVRITVWRIEMSKGLLCLIGLLVAASAAMAGSGAIRWVGPGQQFSTIQAAVNESVDTDNIYVVPGTYHENIDFNGKAILVTGHALPGTTVTGLSHLVIIDGLGNGPTVRFSTGESRTSYLRDCTVTGGTGVPGTSNQVGGGGIYINAASPSLVRVIVTGNTATSYGGGIACVNAFSDNQTPYFSNCEIYGNTSGGQGGGISLVQSSPYMTGAKIHDNSGIGVGGGVYCYNNSSPTVIYSTFYGNTCGAYGNGDGGAIGCISSHPVLQNCLFYNNTAQYRGGAISCYASSPQVKSCTIDKCGAAMGGAISCFEGSNPAVRNSVITWATDGGGIYGSNSAPSVFYSDLYGNTDGNYVGVPDRVGLDGNICGHPRYAAGYPAAIPDYHERSVAGRWYNGHWVYDDLTSRLVDTGDPASGYDNEQDPNGGRINMGRYGNTTEASLSPGASLAPLRLTSTAAPTGVGLSISVRLSRAAQVSAAITNVAGRVVAVLPGVDAEKGLLTLSWNRRSATGLKVPSGRYLIRITARSGSGESATEMVVVSLE
jgi:predicted outer membrane repeat protein